MNISAALESAILPHHSSSEGRTTISEDWDIDSGLVRKEYWGELGRSTAVLQLTLESTWLGIEPLGPL